MSKININQWINDDPGRKEFRQAVHTILTAISSTPELKDRMIMKGGVLLALGYDSSRFTKDIDFSTSTVSQDFDLKKFRSDFEHGLVQAVAALGYGLDCRVQSCKQQPIREDAEFPTIKLTVGYADMSNSRARKRLMANNSSEVVEVDYSLNEPEGSPEVICLEDGQGGNEKIIRTYSFVDLVAEKFRALLQQKVRNRSRRQDVYDLYLLLIEQNKFRGDHISLHILISMKQKSDARKLNINRLSMRDEEIIKRTREGYPQLKSEIEGDLLPFDEVYKAVQDFYEALPWQTDGDHY